MYAHLRTRERVSLCERASSPVNRGLRLYRPTYSSLISTYISAAVVAEIVTLPAWKQLIWIRRTKHTACGGITCKSSTRFVASRVLSFVRFYQTVVKCNWIEFERLYFPFSSLFFLLFLFFFPSLHHLRAHRPEIALRRSYERAENPRREDGTAFDISYIINHLYASVFHLRTNCSQAARVRHTRVMASWTFRGNIVHGVGGVKGSW